MTNTTKWSLEFLESMRQVTDPLADKVVATIIESGYEEKINEAFYSLVRNSGFSPADFAFLPQEVRDAVVSYFENSAALPEWADQDLMKIGEDVFSLHGPEIALILNVKSLPLCYACSKGAQVLYMTGRLTERTGSIDQLARRLMETSQMIINALAPNGMAPGGNGIITIQKVRLIHASIRYFLQHPKFNPQGWDVQHYGLPINQEDMAGTLMSFAPLVLDGLDQLNIKLTPSQKQGYMHAWKVIGYLMGVNEKFLVDTFEEGWDLGVTIMRHQAAESEHGKALTSACIDFLTSILPGNIFDSVPEYMIWYFVQDISKAIDLDLGKALGVENGHHIKNDIVFKICELFFVEVSKADSHSKVIAELTKLINRKLLNGFLHHFNDGKNVRFFIPPSLQDDWKLRDTWNDEYVLSPTILGRRLVIQQKKDSLT